MKSQTYLVPGIYVCNTDVRAKTLKNCPTNVAFTLFVYKTLLSDALYYMQEYRTLMGYVYKRRYAGYDENIQNNNDWGEAMETVVSANFGSPKIIDLKTGTGVYFQVGTANDYTKFVINNKWVVIEHYTDGKRDKITTLWDGINN